VRAADALQLPLAGAEPPAEVDVRLRRPVVHPERHRGDRQRVAVGEGVDRFGALQRVDEGEVGHGGKERRRKGIHFAMRRFHNTSH
jgi:hypothetical protein